MSFEFSQSTTIEKEEALDDKWYERFSACGSFADYEYLGGDKSTREKQKSAFVRGECENPTLDYPELEKLDITRKEEELLQLKRDILEQETNETIKQVYRWKINEKIAELRMLREAKNGNDKRFLRYSEFIYGKPEKQIYDYTINQIRRSIDEKINDPNENVRMAAQRLRDEIIDFSQSEQSEIEELKGFMRSSDSKEFADTEYTAEEIKSAFEQELKKYELSGWTVAIVENGTAINVSQENKKVNIPSDRKIKEKKLRALIEHEIGTHVLRRERGEKSKLKLLGLGLDRYIKGEEGVATFEEQKILGANEFFGFEGHLAIALAMGMDGKKRDFRKVYEILKDYNFINSKKEESETMKQAEDSAWKRCVRTFRGTTCETPGVCFTRDIVYREGNIGIWFIVKNGTKEIRRFKIGKYDPTNPRHIWILEQLGITDRDLEELNGYNY